MAFFKDPAPASKAAEAAQFDPPTPAELLKMQASTPVRAAESPARESVIAADLAIEGKIEGAGNVRIAGRFKGDIKVQGNLTIDQGAKVSGGITASKVTLAGELEGNVTNAQQVDILSSGTINGDLKAGSLTVAAGARIRGQVDCGWGKDEKAHTKPEAPTAA